MISSVLVGLAQYHFDDIHQIICNWCISVQINFAVFSMLAKFPGNVQASAISFFVRYFNTLLTMLAQSDSSFSLEILKVVPFEHLIVQCASNEKAGDV